MDAVLAETLAARMNQIVPLKGMIADHEKRYAATLREIEHHREALAELVRAIKEAQYAEFENVDARAVNGAAQHDE